MFYVNKLIQKNKSWQIIPLVKNSELIIEKIFRNISTKYKIVYYLQKKDLTESSVRTSYQRKISDKTFEVAYKLVLFIVFHKRIDLLPKKLYPTDR